MNAAAVEDNPGPLGWAAGVLALVADESFGSLRAPVVRVSGGAVPLPSARSP